MKRARDREGERARDRKAERVRDREGDRHTFHNSMSFRKCYNY